MGRWCSRDPVINKSLLPFVNNNPVNMYDSLGLRFHVDYHDPSDESSPQGLWHDGSGNVTVVTQNPNLEVYYISCGKDKFKLMSTFGDMIINVYFKSQLQIPLFH